MRPGAAIGGGLEQSSANLRSTAVATNSVASDPASAPSERVPSAAGPDDALVSDNAVVGTGSGGSLLTAVLDLAGQARIFKVPQCGRSFTLPELYPVFAAHQVEWNIMGRDNAWWSVLTDHPEWSNPPTDAQKDQFYDLGREHVELLTKAITANTLQDEWAVYATREPQFEDHPIGVVSSNVKSPFRLTPKSGKSPFGKVLDFGCGLGRLAFNFAKIGSTCACVDQSMHHLRQAEAEWNTRKGLQRGLQDSIKFVPSSPDILGAMQGERFDFVHSVLVLQHMVPPLQAVYMEQFCDLLNVGGQGWVQIPIQVQNAACDIAGSVRVGGMQMHFTPAKDIKDHMAARGCDVQVLSLSRRYMGQGESGLVIFRKVK